VHWNHFVGALDFHTFSTKYSSSSSDETTLRTFFFIYLDSRDSTWLSLNNLLHLTDLTRASASASNASFIGVLEKTTLLFCLRLSPNASAFGKRLNSTGFLWCRLIHKNE
jgi:hypothetical protein